MDELRDRIAEALNDAAGMDLNDAAQSMIDALGLHHVEGTDGEWRYVTAWQDTERPF